jgi:D-threo-aldose 1-dehydrogenase
MAQTVSLPHRSLGQTGLEVTPLCIGCSVLGSMPETFGYAVAEEQALSTIRAIFESPINFLDTAAAYGDGESERRLGIVLREYGGLPEGIVLSTKADRNLHTGEFTGPQMRRSIERSLGLLGLQQLQLVYFHDPEHITFEEAMAPAGPVEVLLQYRNEGLIAHLGIAGGPIALMSRFVETGLFEVALSHNRYTLLNTEADSFWDLCLKRGVAAINGAPYGSGMLAKGPSAYPRYLYADADPLLVMRARQIEALCQRYAIPLAAAALQFSLRDERITSTIVGMSRPERIAETIALARYAIPEAFWAEFSTLAEKWEPISPG